MSNDLALWVGLLFLIVPALLYAAIVIRDMKKEEKKS